jgi:hypothetical protein
VKTLSPRLRQLTLTTHVATSVGWLGAVVAFLAVAVAALVDDSASDRGLYPAMQVIANAVIVPLAFAALVTGVVSALGTSWGLLRHYWVVTKLVVVVIATVVLLLQLGPLAIATDAATSTPARDVDPETASLVLHSAGGLAVLLFTTVLGVYKPRGMTRYGLRRAASR